MENLKRKYAKFLIEGCLRLKAGDKLFIFCYDIIKYFVDMVILEAKKLGIQDIETLLVDVRGQKEYYLTKSYEEIIRSPLFDRTKFNQMAKEGYAFLSLSSTLPGFYEEVDAELLNKVGAYQAKTIKEYREYQQKGLIKWNISCVPNEIWAKDLGMCVDDLWKVIFDICKINEDDPIQEWTNKMNTLKSRAMYLNSLDIDHLIYTNSLGTNLEIGFPKGYLFQSADGDNIVNMPTEEVFTSPDRLKVNGRVYSSKVLLHNNRLIEDFYLEFKDGKVIDFDAKKGKDILKNILDTDEGSRYLGEVALVDFDSPISKSGIIFKNTLYDENASCHLALGQSFPECIENGLTMSKEELSDHHLNFSQEHVDFFIGTRDLNIIAVLQNKEEKVIMKQGNFVMEVNK